MGFRLRSEGMDGSRLLGGGSPCGSYRGGAYGRMADEDCSAFNSQGGGLDVTYEFRRAFQFHAVRDCYIADDLAVDDDGFGVDFRPDDGVLAYGKHPFGGNVAFHGAVNQQVIGKTQTLPHENSREAFPWGYSWPPPDKTGNFADQSALIYLPSSRVIVGYNDGQPYTAPVKTFPPNHLGLYDLEGNVMEWVDDSYGGPESLPIRNYGVARGGSYLSFRPKQLTTSIRTPLPENTRDNALGFRLILSSERPAIPTAP